MKKKILLGLCIISGLILMGCSSTQKNYTTVTKAHWYVKKAAYNDTLSSYQVHLSLVGKTDAKTLSVTTFGGGVLSDKKIILSNNTFDEDVTIAFFMLSKDKINPNYKTAVKVTSEYADGKTDVTEIKSPNLDFTKAK